MTLRNLLATERPLVMPGAHDAISARLIQRAGFKAYFIGGFPLVGARYAVPDIGLMGLGEIGAGMRDTIAASNLPVLVDGDNGYGDVKTIVHTLHFYERLGAQGIMFEDQVSPKRCGHIQGKAVIPVEQMEARYRAVAGNRMIRRLYVLAPHGCARHRGPRRRARRAERYLPRRRQRVPASIPAHSVEELAEIGGRFAVPQVADMLEGGRTPILRRPNSGSSASASRCTAAFRC